MSVKKQDNLLKDFMVEAEEIIETVDQNLYLLDSEKDNGGEPSPNAIHSLFRAVHTLKGSAGMVGLMPVSTLSHRMEDLLDRLRLGKLNWNIAVFDLLTEATNGLRTLLKMMNSPDQKRLDITPTVTRIEKMLTGEALQDESPLSGSGVDPEILKTFTEYESHRLTENIKKTFHIYEIRAQFKMDSFDVDLARTLEQIKAFGEVIASLPVTGLSLNEGIMFKIIVASKEDLAQKEIKWAGENIQMVEVKTAGFLNSTGAEKSVSPRTHEENFDSIKSVTQTVRVDISKLDTLMNIVGELVLSKSVIHQMARTLIEQYGVTSIGVDFQKTLESMGKKIGDLQENLIQVRMTPVGQIFDRLLRMVKKISREINKPVNIHISGEETALDKSMIEAIADPLMHLIRNAIDHGLEVKEERSKAGKSEAGNIHLRACQKGNQVLIEVEDDGQWIELQAVYQKAIEKKLADPKRDYSPKELIDFIFLPGFSTSKKVSDLSGRGVGLDVVAKNIARLSGMVDVSTDPGRGTKFSITLPITLIIIRALIVKIGMETYALPLNSVSESLIADAGDIQSIDQREVIQLRDHTLSLLRLEELFQMKLPPSRKGSLYVIVIGSAEKRIGLIVDDIQGQQEIVIKSLGNILGTMAGIAGACELGNKKTILVLDVAMLIEAALKKNR
ncbi:MAG: chemotaxis protein CheA [Nitrospirae bacterium]|nr:chemotaxis protein CheA [Nitrospirota bacterium]